jgi:hypothetical protein
MQLVSRYRRIELGNFCLVYLAHVRLARMMWPDLAAALQRKQQIDAGGGFDKI